MNFEVFENSLLQANESLFKKVLKTNTHAHGLLSSNQTNFYKEFGKKIDTFEGALNIKEFNEFVNRNLNVMIKDRNKQFKLYELSILTAINDGVSIFDISLDYKTVYKLFDNSVENYINSLKELKEKYCSKINLNFDLGISRKSYKKQDNLLIKKLIDSGMFNGIDLYGDELSRNISVFKKIYKYAKTKKLLLKAHVGEFGNAHSIKRAIKVLKLNVVHHGISIIENEKIMGYAKRKKIKFNVCVSSNLLMSRVKNIKNHPIRKMYDYGLLVTISTDDELIFSKSLFEEYLLLYKNNIFNIDELYNILENGFDNYDYKKIDDINKHL